MDADILVELALDAGQRQSQLGAGFQQGDGGGKFAAALVAIFVILGDALGAGEAILQGAGDQGQVLGDDVFGCRVLFHAASMGVAEAVWISPVRG